MEYCHQMQQQQQQQQPSWPQHEMPPLGAAAAAAAAAAVGGSGPGYEQCWYCPYRSRYRSNLNRHMKKLHDMNLPKMGPGRKPMHALYPTLPAPPHPHP